MLLIYLSIVPKKICKGKLMLIRTGTVIDHKFRNLRDSLLIISKRLLLTTTRCKQKDHNQHSC